MKSRTRSLLRSDHATAVKLELDETFQPCPAEPGEELYRNGIFEFNITRLLAFMEAHVERFSIERIEIDGIANYGDESLDQEAISTADLLQPILLAEISPGLFNLIDGHHRVAKARREGVRALPAHRIYCPHHVRFLTSTRAYERYVAYWNEKLALSERR